MFNFFKAECPVNEDDKKWIEGSLSWFFAPARTIDYSAFRFIPITDYFTVSTITLTKNHVEQVFERVKKQMHFPEELSCEIKLFAEDDLRFSEGLSTKSVSGQKANYYGYMRGNTFVFELNEKYLSDPFAIVSGIAYNLAFYKLKEEKNLVEINGYVNTLGATLFGFGVFQANSVISYNQWTGTSHQGWSIGRQGFLTQQMYGYVLALAAFIKNEKNPKWAAELCRDVKAYFERAAKYIHANADYYKAYKNGIAENSSETPPDYTFVKKNYVDNNRILSSVSEMKNGKKHGITTFYHKNVKPWACWEYKDDVPWTVHYNHDSKGKELEKGTLKEGNGTLYSYKESGTLTKVYHYENGMQTKIEIYYENGHLSQVSEISNGKYDGITTFYHKNGVLWAEWEYKNNVHWNVAFNYNDKSEAQEKGTLKDGTGTLYSYEDDGKLARIWHYENGELLNEEIF
ncbi:MAG: hypothetical protein JWP12_2892 [Bacteroidetes bacterium]|nr:hypothetical protein [Bacteroidota bacterium]